jgi:hypothetical protein
MALLTPITTGRNTNGDLVNLQAAAAGGDSWANTGVEFLVVKNGDVGSHTLTFAIQQALDGNTPSGKQVVVAAGKTIIIGPFSGQLYNDQASPPQIRITYDAVTSVTVGVFKLGST